MTDYHEAIWTNRPVRLDGNRYFNCRMERCDLLFAGDGKPIVLKGCGFFDCRLVLDGPAANTLQFLRAMYLDGSTHFVEEFIDYLRGGPAPPSR